MCAYCAAMLVFTDALALRLLSPDEFTALDNDVAIQINRCRSAIREVHKGGR